ncbi:MAG: LysE family translocator [Desulfovibrionaceae bacterium]|jgi:threonine/homoserine/homoserine lactone efflux protein|nr:LysE family translocator [Desulfovibrionaceae bacterium]
MTFDHAVAFFLFSVVAAITPGPSNLILTSTGANSGVVRSLPCLFGVALGMGAMMFVISFGLGAIVLEHPKILSVFKVCCVAFLLWLAWKIATAGPAETTTGKGFLGFWGAWLFQWANPKAWMACVGAAGAYMHSSAAGSFEQSISFGMIFILAALPCCFLWLAFGAGLRRILQTNRAMTAFNVTMGLALAGSVLLVIR